MMLRPTFKESPLSFAQGVKRGLFTLYITLELFQVYQIERVRALGNGSAYFGNTMKR